MPSMSEEDVYMVGSGNISFKHWSWDKFMFGICDENMVHSQQISHPVIEFPDGTRVKFVTMQVLFVHITHTTRYSNLIHITLSPFQDVQWRLKLDYMNWKPIYQVYSNLNSLWPKFLRNIHLKHEISRSIQNCWFFLSTTPFCWRRTNTLVCWIKPSLQRKEGRKEGNLLKI